MWKCWGGSDLSNLMWHFEDTDSYSHAPGDRRHCFQFSGAAGVEILSKGMSSPTALDSSIACGSWGAWWESGCGYFSEQVRPSEGWRQLGAAWNNLTLSFPGPLWPLPRTRSFLPPLEISGRCQKSFLRFLVIRTVPSQQQSIQSGVTIIVEALRQVRIVWGQAWNSQWGRGPDQLCPPSPSVLSHHSTAASDPVGMMPRGKRMGEKDRLCHWHCHDQALCPSALVDAQIWLRLGNVLGFLESPPPARNLPLLLPLAVTKLALSTSFLALWFGMFCLTSQFGNLSFCFKHLKMETPRVTF